jgi:uncharacterized protein
VNYRAAKNFIIEKLERELLPIYTYHGLHHTLDVLAVTKNLCKAEGINPHETTLLKTAALYHDAGFTVSPKEHEATGCDIARLALPSFDYNAEDIYRICGMIMATKIPQNPQNHLECIICDADLDYLGRDDFFPIGNTLFEELKALGILETPFQWNTMQVKFLENHAYHTITTQLLRESKKQAHIAAVKALLIP